MGHPDDFFGMAHVINASPLLRHDAEHLSNGDKKASQLAFDLGYPSVQQFCKSFRQKFGYLLSQVKKNMLSVLASV